MVDEDEVPVIGVELLYQWDFWRSVLAEFIGMTFFLFVTIGTVIFGVKGGSEGAGFVQTVRADSLTRLHQRMSWYLAFSR